MNQTDVFISGQDGYKYFRIPSIIVTQDGTVLAFCEGRMFRLDDKSPTDIVLKRSLDNGKTWLEQQVAVEGIPHAVADPCPVVDRDTGTIWLMYDRYPEGFEDGKTGMGLESGTNWVTHSTDDGKTWSEPVNITETTKEPNWSSVHHGPGCAAAGF